MTEFAELTLSQWKDSVSSVELQDRLTTEINDDKIQHNTDMNL